MTPPRVLVLDGGSSAGKTSVARELQPLLEGAWLRLGVDTLVDAAPPSLLGEGGLEFGDAQERRRAVLASLPMGRVGIRCEPSVAARRESARGDRVAGMARTQALAVHEGIEYDLEVDTTSSPPADLARRIHQHFFVASRGDR